MPREIRAVESPKLVKPVKPYYKPAVMVKGGKLLFISGVPPFDPNGNLIGKGDIKAQTKQVIENMKRILEEAGGSLDDIVCVTVYLTDIRYFEDVAEVRLQYFRNANMASTLVEVSKLYHPDQLIEISAIAVLKD
jgi:reactive intermediate/imine deaminase